MGDTVHSIVRDYLERPILSLRSTAGRIIGALNWYLLFRLLKLSFVEFHFLMFSGLVLPFLFRRTFQNANFEVEAEA